MDGHAVIEDHRHRVLDNGECQRAREEQGDDQHGADHPFVVEKGRQVGHQGQRFTGHHEFQICGQGREQSRLVDEVRKPNQHQNQQRDQRQERVVRNGPGQEKPLIGAKAFEHPQRENAGMLQDFSRMVAGPTFWHNRN